MLCDHLGPFELQHNLGGLWHFWCGAWILFARMERAGTTTIDTAIPRLGDGPFEVAFLSQHFRRRLTDLGERLDRRNGNDYRKGRIAAVEQRIDWQPLPDRDDG